MSRQIRFRAWDGKSMCYEDGEKYVLRFDGLIGMFNLVTQKYNSQDWPLMQSTGLKDKHGKDIFEGDVISVRYDFYDIEDNEYKLSHPAIGYVDWNEHSTGWIVRTKSPMSVSDDGTVMTSIICEHGEREILGSVYETPDLLK